jgi:N6-adenosine-specific RNA methylase IME4
MTGELAIIDDLAERIRLLDQEVESAAQITIDRIVECGALLIEAKRVHAHGEWLPFLQRAGMPARKAQRYMVLADKYDTVSYLGGQRAALEHLTRLNSTARQIEKAEKRARRELDLSARITALPDKRYGVIVADPEWRFEPYSRDSGLDRAADNHYPTSATAIIASRPVGEIAADDCLLGLWATVPMLPDALAVMDAWGFAYRSSMAWVKDRIGTGYWFRNQHELFLLGVRGNVPAPSPGLQSPSVVHAPVGKHSAKPEIFLDILEIYFPTLPKIELNRRGPARPGWDAWGNEVEAAA